MVDGPSGGASTSIVPAKSTQDLDLLKGLHRKALDALKENLVAGESVQVVIRGVSNQAIIGTDRRAFVFKKGMMAGAAFGSEMTSWAYRNLMGVQLHTGMMSGAVVLQGPGQQGSKTSYWQNGDSDPHKAPNAIPVVRPFDDAKAGVSRFRQFIDAAHKPADQVGITPSPVLSVADELTKLAELRNAGVLSGDEFTALKAKLLG